MQEKIMFITRREHKITCPDIEVTNKLDLLLNFLTKAQSNPKKIVGLDTENSSLNPFIAIPLLAQFGDENEVFVLDRTSFDLEFIRNFTNIQYIGQNIQYDHTVIRWNEGKKPIDLRNVLDIMVHEQIIGRGIGRSNSLEAAHLRRLGVEYPEKKDTRKEFIKMKKHSIFEDRHIIYAAADIPPLCKVFNIQREIIAQTHLEHRIYNIGNPLIPILGEMCLNGSMLDTKKWMNVYNDNKKIKREIEAALDTELVKLGYPTKVRKRQDVIVFDLFGADAEMSNQCFRNIKYSSPKQVLEIFNYFKMAKPMAQDKETYEMKPSVGGEALEQYNLDNPGNKLTNFIKLLIELAGVTKRINSFGINFTSSIYPDPNKPNSKNNLIRGFFNPLTNKVHTKYKQEFTANGRLSSGSDKGGLNDNNKKQETKKSANNVFFNSQQLPKENRYRECFILEPELVNIGWWRTTIDLAGAELIILGCQSGDKKLLELQATDLHSYLATKGFTRIIQYIVNNMSEARARLELYDLLRVNKVFEIITNSDNTFLTKEEKDKITRDRIEQALKDKSFVINKSTAKDIRDAVKNAVYASCYGAKEDRIAGTLGIAKDYAGMFLAVMREELPIAFGYLEKIARTAVKEGFVVFNKRTNSRHIFKEYLEAQKYNRQLNKSQISEITRNAMNYVISGTQADMIKEGMVEVDKFLKTGKSPYVNNKIVDRVLLRDIEENRAKYTLNDKIYTNGVIPHKWIFQIHDEFVFDHPIKKIGKVAANIATNVANQYLYGLAEMKANVETLHCWTK